KTQEKWGGRHPIERRADARGAPERGQFVARGLAEKRPNRPEQPEPGRAESCMREDLSDYERRAQLLPRGRRSRRRQVRTRADVDAESLARDAREDRSADIGRRTAAGASGELEAEVDRRRNRRRRRFRRTRRLPPRRAAGR